MNDLQINCFLAVARNLSFSKTANELYVSQPAVSKQISSMENELGFILFDRTNKVIKLTEVGRLFYEFYTEYKESFREVMLSAQMLSNKKPKILKIGCHRGWDVSLFMNDAIKNFHTAYPDVEVTVELLDNQEMRTAISEGKIDIGIELTNSIKNLQLAESVQFFEIRKMLLFSANHPLAKKEDLKPEDFKNEYFDAPTPSSNPFARKAIKETMEKYHFTPLIRTSECDYQNRLYHIQNSNDILIMDEWSREKNNSLLAHLLLEQSHKISMVWSQKERDTIVERFVKMTADFARVWRQSEK